MVHVRVINVVQIVNQPKVKTKSTNPKDFKVHIPPATHEDLPLI